MAQTTTRPVGLLKYMQSKSFAEGFREARRGEPFNYARVEAKCDLPYEMGRQFGTIYSGSLKNGNTIERHAARAFSQALSDKVIIA